MLARRPGVVEGAGEIDAIDGTGGPAQKPGAVGETDGADGIDGAGGLGGSD